MNEPNTIELLTSMPAFYEWLCTVGSTVTSRAGCYLQWCRNNIVDWYNAVRRRAHSLNAWARHKDTYTHTHADASTPHDLTPELHQKRVPARACCHPVAIIQSGPISAGNSGNWFDQIMKLNLFAGSLGDERLAAFSTALAVLPAQWSSRYCCQLECALNSFIPHTMCEVLAVVCCVRVWPS